MFAMRRGYEMRFNHKSASRDCQWQTYFMAFSLEFELRIRRSPEFGYTIFGQKSEKKMMQGHSISNGRPLSCYSTLIHTVLHLISGSVVSSLLS